MMETPNRKPTRLSDYDYSTGGAYFVTICTHNRRQILSRIVGQGLAPAECVLSQYGKIAQQELLALETRYKCIKIDGYVIMPNHIHAIISINEYEAGASPCPTLSSVVCTFKSLTSRKCRKINPDETVWQTSFFDHIIRNREDYEKHMKYILENPTRWMVDELYQ